MAKGWRKDGARVARGSDVRATQHMDSLALVCITHNISMIINLTITTCWRNKNCHLARGSWHSVPRPRYDWTTSSSSELRTRYSFATNIVVGIPMENGTTMVPNSVPKCFPYKATWLSQSFVYYLVSILSKTWFGLPTTEIVAVEIVPLVL